MAKKTERIIVRLTKEELEELQSIADLEDKSVSEVIRGFIKFRSNYYQKNKTKPVKETPVVKAKKKEVYNINSFDWLDENYDEEDYINFDDYVDIDPSLC